jgi:hypothetical protein
MVTPLVSISRALKVAGNGVICACNGAVANTTRIVNSVRIITRSGKRLLYPVARVPEGIHWKTNLLFRQRPKWQGDRFLVEMIFGRTSR